MLSLNSVYLVLCMLECLAPVGFTCLFLVYLLGVVIVVIACVVLSHATLSMSANIVLWIIPFPCLYNGVNYEEIFFPVWLCWLWKVSVNVGSVCECGECVWVWEVDVSVGSRCECGNWLSVGSGWVWVWGLTEWEWVWVWWVTVSVGVGVSVESDCECGNWLSVGNECHYRCGCVGVRLHSVLWNHCKQPPWVTSESTARSQRLGLKLIYSEE